VAGPPQIRGSREAMVLADVTPVSVREAGAVVEQPVYKFGSLSLPEKSASTGSIGSTAGGGRIADLPTWR